jgi:hypothetical protein
MTIAALHIGMLAFGFDHLLGDIELRMTRTGHLFIVGMTTDTLCARIIPCPIAQQGHNKDKLEKKDNDGFAINIVAQGAYLHAQLWLEDSGRLFRRRRKRNIVLRGLIVAIRVSWNRRLRDFL